MPTKPDEIRVIPFTHPLKVPELIATLRGLHPQTVVLCDRIEVSEDGIAFVQDPASPVKGVAPKQPQTPRPFRRRAKAEGADA